ncbi:MAG: hypothetical protein E5W55_12350 [Mesorhizobium sp.]|nr:MAG: hypothetical protein E5W55_12350 [Mesorhizobium sp.]
MVEVFNFELARARQRVRAAERSLARVHEMLGERCGVAVNLSLCDRIRSEEQQLSEARERFIKIVPASEPVER